MALDPATELRELDAILSSTDDPDTKRARIASLYTPTPEMAAANDPRGMSPEATALVGAGGTGGDGGMSGGPNMSVDPSMTPAPTVTDVPPVNPGAGGHGGTLGNPAPEIAAQGGTSANLPMPLQEHPLRPESARATPELATGIVRPLSEGPGAPLKSAKKIPPKGAAEPTVPAWLRNEMDTPENYFGRPDPIGRPVTKPEDAAYRGLESAQLEGVRAQAEAEDRAIQAGARAELAAVERGQLVDAELARRELERQNNLAAMERGFAEMLSEASREPIDSGRLWNNSTTGEKLLSKIALFVGTIGAGAAGQPNLVMQKMEADIDRDLQAQKANKAFQLQKLAAEGTLYGMARDRFASEAAVDAAMKETAWRRIGAELNAFKTKAQDPARKAAIDLLVDQTEGKILDAERQRRLLNDADTLARLRASATANVRKPPPRNEVAKLIEGLSTQDGIIKKLQRIKELTGPAGNRVWGSDTKGAAETLVHKLQLEYKRGENTGTLDKGSLDFFNSMIGDPSAFFRNPNSTAKLDQLIQDAQAKQLQLSREFEQLQQVKTGASTRGTGAVQH